MTDSALEALAKSAGLATVWTDYKGDSHRVSPETLRAVLAALELPAGSPGEIAESARRLAKGQSPAGNALITADARGLVSIAVRAGKGELVLEGGDRLDVDLVETGPGEVSFDVPDRPGYHTLETGRQRVSLAVAPRLGWTVADAASGRRPWGVAVQLYSLRGGTTAGFGDFAALAEFGESAAKLGADAIAVSPTHALFSADPGRYAPYGPSSRLFLNPLYGALDGPAPAAIETADGLIDWPGSAGRKLAELRDAYGQFRDTPAGTRDAFSAFVADGGPRLLAHARFEALDARFRARGITHWRNWPDGFAHAAGAPTAGLPADDPEVEFHLFLQFVAERSLSDAQRRARGAGMAIGIIADVAVGIDGGGSDSWSRPKEVLTGIGIGAPPDLLGPDGQNWGLISFSPTGLAKTGFEGFLSMLRAAMRNAGGVRIDHAMGLQRLWVVPDGATADQGTYLAYPRTDLLRLLALESVRHRAIVVGEDLGTVPAGFRPAIAKAGMLGMRVLWFERASDGAFTPPADWDREALALTTTHDLPTIAGWWLGRDIEWRARTSGRTDRAAIEQGERAADRPRLWKALCDSGRAAGPAPEREDPAQVVDAAVSMVADTVCRMAIVPVEDLLGLEEQPNLPGTIDTHPNWRRRLPPGDPFADRDVLRRIETVNKARAVT